MKKILVACLMFSPLFLLTSCLEEGGDEYTIDPYVALKSFSLDDLPLYTGYVTSEGEDTVAVSWVYGANYPFVIDQKSREVYNPDSWPYGVDLTKVLVNVDSDGIAYLYNDSAKTYTVITSTDSLDFSYPRRLFVSALGGEFVQEYKVTVNAHKIDPYLMVWDSLSVAAGIAKPVSMFEQNGKLYLFGTDAEGKALSSSIELDAPVAWSVAAPLSSGNETLQLESIKLFKDKFYAVTSSGMLMISEGGVEWQSVANDNRFVNLFAATGSELWAVTADSILCSNDGVAFAATEQLPDGFPLYNVSDNTYPLATNKYITRSLLVGYPAEEENARPMVWSKLSTEDEWSRYIIASDSSYSCPALRPLSVMQYDNSIYAIGGKGLFGKDSVDAFSAIYTSPDNGLTWSELSNSKIKLPVSLKSNDAPFVAMVASKKYMWIVTGGEKPSVWRGVINRLLFKD